MVNQNRLLAPIKGFTLIEVLIALLITSLLVSILMGSLYYLSRVQESLRNEIVVREAELRSKAWYSEVLAGCMPAESGSGAGFVGSAREIACDSTSPLRPRLVGVSLRVHLALRRGEDGRTQITYREHDSPESSAHVIAALGGGDAVFKYVGVSGQEFENWPPKINDPETLPRRIRLVTSEAPAGESEWGVTIRADPWLEPVFKNPFGMELPK